MASFKTSLEMHSSESNLITIGKITKTHGIKGELRLLPFFEDISFLADVKIVYFLSESDCTAHKLKTLRPHSKFILLKISYKPVYNYGVIVSLL